LAISATTATFQPQIWLGAPATSGLALPAAQPTPDQLYAPRGVFFNDDYLIVADSGNHRVLIWHGLPNRDHRPADVVLGQPDLYSEGPQAGGRGAERGLYLPTGVSVVAGRLLVADAWNHRILIWNQVPDCSDQPADVVIGQPDFRSVEPNRGQSVDALGLYWPYGIAYVAGRCYVADTGNRRVLGWEGLPEPGQPPDLILGQPSPHDHDENRGGPANADSFRWPHGFAGDTTTLYVADAGNHRVLGWSPPPTSDQPANLVLGQPNFVKAQEWPYGPQSASGMRFPYAITLDAGVLAVADTANNRVLIWEQLPRTGVAHPADQVLGQPDFGANGENHWKAVARNSLCWPYGIHLHRNRLAIADSGNNRVMIWQRESDERSSI
jgi:hypothetical protein